MKISREFTKYVRYATIKGILPFKRFDIRDSIVICSEPRSGSTWLMEMLQRHPHTISNWEPLFVDLGVVPEKFNLGWRPYISEHNSSPELRQLFEDILTFRLVSQWTASQLKIKDLITAQTVLTKFVRASRLLPWLTQQFNLTRKPIYLTRHPISTCLSQKKHFKPLHIQDIEFQHEQPADDGEYKKRLSIFKELSGQLEQRVAFWAMHNAEVIQHPRHNQDWMHLYYEDIVRNPHASIEYINKELDLSVPLGELDPNRPSRSDFMNDFVADNAEVQLSQWMDQMSNTELTSIQRILDFFNITQYSAFSPFPVEVIKN